MRRQLIEQCVCLIEAKAQARGRSLSPPAVQLWEAVLGDMDDQMGCQALRNVLLNSPFPPDWADVRQEYSDLVGAAPEETPDEAVARQKRQAEYRARMEEQRERHVEKCRAIYGWFMADPERRREWFRSHSSENMPFADLLGENRGEVNESQ
ncbi:MAG TPA: hypothetical protein VFJ58_17275 [Armatimonadota bacterium]|nr:hypothetical protein [Armatimonadota bacterium]